MRKSLLIGVMVLVLAVGAIGAAFATGLDINSMGPLSAGYSQVPQVNVEQVKWISELDYDGCTGEPELVGVHLTFDQPLYAKSVVKMHFFDANWNLLGELASGDISPGIPAGDQLTMKWDKEPCDRIPIKDIYHTMVAVEGAPIGW